VKRLAVVVLLATLLAPAAATRAAGGAVPFCRGSALAGTFSVVPGSAGAGGITYVLALRNRSTRACAVTGLPVLQLLGRYGRKLPTHVRAARVGIATAVLVTLRPGALTSVTARFSPDVPGPGEPVAGRRCELTAYKLRVTARGGGSTVVPIVKPTPVCEHGSLSVSVYVAGRRVVTP
jgi:Protein of unknown function (DUF4232)